MAPLAFTLIMIGFANVIRTQVVLPQKRDHIFVKSVCCGAVVNRVTDPAMIPYIHIEGIDVLAYIGSDAKHAANDIRGLSVFDLPADAPVLAGAREALTKLAIL